MIPRITQETIVALSDKQKIDYKRLGISEFTKEELLSLSKEQPDLVKTWVNGANQLRILVENRTNN